MSKFVCGQKPRLTNTPCSSLLDSSARAIETSRDPDGTAEVIGAPKYCKLPAVFTRVVLEIRKFAEGN